MEGPLDRLMEMTRREFVSRGLTAAGWGAFAVVLGTGTIETVRFFFPRVRFQPPSTFRIGTPDDFVGPEENADSYGVIMVDERWKAANRFFVVRERGQIYAISARCVHLGCTINWFGDTHIFRCPCHGSEYRSNGVNFAGPAPRAVDRFQIELSVDGQLVVDTGVVYGPDRYQVDGAFVRV